MATRKITKKVKVVEPDLANPTYTHEWSVEDNTNYASINDFYLTYNDINYYFTKPNTIEIGDKFYFNINTKVLKLNEDTISTSTTGSSNNELIFVPPHKWSDEYINIGANAENVFCSDGKTVEEKLSGLGGDYVEKTGDTMTGNLTTPGLTVGSRKNEEIIGANSVAEGYNVVASGLHSHAEGHTTTASGRNSHAEGEYTIASGNESHTEGQNAIASGDYSHAEGYSTTAIGQGSHAEGFYNVASGIGSHAEGSSYISTSNSLSLTGEANATTYTTNNTTGVNVGGYLLYRSTWSKITAFVSDRSITVDSTLSNEALMDARVLLAEGIASGDSSHVEGHGNVSSGDSSHAEGYKTEARGPSSHAEGQSTISGGAATHTEGIGASAYGNFSHAEGNNTRAYRKSQHVEGEYNIIDTSGDNQSQKGDYVHIVGNGITDRSRSNAHTLDWSGNAWFAGDVYTGSAGGKNKDEGSKKLATEEYVETNGGKIDSISIDGRAQTIDANKNVNLTGLEKAFNKVTSLSDSSTNDQYPSAKAVYDEINTKISTVYKAKGTCTFANKPALNANNEGFVYNISDAFTTTSDFVEGAGKSYPAGTNIVVINNGTTASPSWKYDVLAGMTDLSGYVAKAGDTMTGTLKISSGDLKVVTGIIHGEDNGTASYTNHAIKLGHAQQDYCDFYEYGGIFNFYKSVNGTNTPLGKITTNGWEGKALLDTGSTAITQPIDTNNTTIATTAFVKSVTQNMITYGAAEPTGSFTAPAGSLYCVYA